MRKKVLLATILTLTFVMIACTKEQVKENEQSNVETTVNSNNQSDDVAEETEYFSDVYFRSEYKESTMSTIYTRKLTSFDAEYLITRYSKDNALNITKEMFEKEYDIEVFEGEDGTIYHLEYWDGYPTGAYAEYSVDRYGVIQNAKFGEGIYVEDKTGFVTVEEAYNKGIDEVYNKYGKDTKMQGSFEETTYTVYYNPEIEKICYNIKNVSGIVGDEEEIYNPVQFTIIASVDGTHLEIASSLMY